MYKYLYKKCLDEDVIRAAWKKLRKGKTKRKDVQYIDAHLDKCVKRMQEMLWNTRPCDVPNPEKAFNPPKHQPRKIYEHGKERTIYCPNIWEQWVHHIIIQVLAPIVTRRAYIYSCGSMPKRGSHYGKRQMERLIKRKFRNFLKCDVRHFFDSIELDVAIGMLEKEIDDDWFIYLIRVTFQHFPKGLPLGFYPSQWIANYILCELDEAILKEHPDGYIRYMDDIVVSDDNKKKLRRILTVIKIELGKLQLKLKRNYQICKFWFVKKTGKVIGRFIDFMGFVFKPFATVLRKKIMVRACRCAERISKVDKISGRQAQSMLSRCGYFTHTDTYHTWLERIKPKINVKQLKRVVSWNMKRRQKKYEKRMARRKKLWQTGAVPAAC